MLEARGLVKRYPGVTALSEVNLTVGLGEVLALIGENGAGKSTLIKIMGGIVAADEGEILIDGKSVSLSKTSDATKLGIGVIHQELSNLDNLDVAGNVFLGREPRKFGCLLDKQELRIKTREYLQQLGLNIDPTTALSALSIAHQQVVEIAKALSLEARFLIMDEPTSSLTTSETQKLLGVINDLRKRGVGIIYVSHRLDEVTALADRVTVLRDGRNAGDLKGPEITTEKMVRLMVGRDLQKTEIRTAAASEPRLIVKELRTPRYPDHAVSFSVGRGEIVGLAGLVGAGRTEVVQAIFGAVPRLSGSVTLDGTEIPSGSPRASIERGLFLAPEDRRHEGLITSMCVRENITLPAVKKYCKAGLIIRSKEVVISEKMRDQLRLKTPTVHAQVSGLSGGNQQKVVLAKWLSLEPKCLLFDEPTRGIDVGARAEIYSLMRELADQSVAILMVSSDMEEVLAVSDRIVVMHEGRVSGELLREDATEEKVMKLAVGHA